MARAGADVTAVDLSPTSVEATNKRLQLKGLKATVRQADAEDLPFADGEFDFIWSWGVIHHSSRTARIVRQMARVCRADGQARAMVYNREGLSARVAFWYAHILKLGFLRRSFDETLHRGSDGFSARFYVPEHFADIFRAFFKDVSYEICGMEADAIPLPRPLRRIAMRFVSGKYLREAQCKRGSFVFVKARNPI
jgi:SAM-dependent methyltransferase